jgi:hypothetical protein
MVSIKGEVNTKMTPNTYSRFVRFLQEELCVSPAHIAFAEKAQATSNEKQRYRDPNPLSMTLLQYGLVTLEQLDKIFDWLETA